MFSNEHQKYLKKYKKSKRIIFISRFLIIILFLFGWQLLVNLNILNGFIFSSPINIFNTLIMLIKTHNLFSHIWITIYETLLSFLLATFLGILFASFLWLSKTVAKIVDPFLTILNSLPKVSLGPIIIIWFGANIKSIIIMAILITVMTSTISIYQGFKEIDKNLLILMKSLNANKLQMFFKLILPVNYQNIISTLKINISLSLIGVIMGELLVSKKGIGYLIMYGSQIFNLNLVMTGIILLAIISAIIYYLILLLEKKLIKID